MKKLIVISLMLFALWGNSQDKRFTMFARTELADKNTHNDVYDYGFNIGVGINYQMTIIYVEAEVYYFPDLNGIDYTHIQGTILGFNHHSRFEDWRFAVGLIRPGFIIRDGSPHAIIGFDAGIEHYFESGGYIGFKTGYDAKGDSQLWSNEDVHYVWYASIKFGITL
jgi:hypothetical protein